jgi:hypothetical protein
MQWGEKGAYPPASRSPLRGNLDMGPGRPALMGPATAGNRPRQVAAPTASMGPAPCAYGTRHRKPKPPSPSLRSCSGPAGL